MVKIDWVDSSHCSGWMMDSDIRADEKNLPHQTIGFVLAQTKNAVTVCQSKGTNQHRNGETSIDSIMEIPIVSITGISFLT